MPISPIQHCISTGCYQNRFGHNKKNISHDSDLNSINSNLSRNIHDFSSRVFHIENSSRVLSTSPAFFPARQGTVVKMVQLMLLLNLLYRVDSASFANKDHPFSIKDNNDTLTIQRYLAENIPIAMSLADDPHLSNQPLLLPEIRKGEIPDENSNSILFINENSHVLSDNQKKNVLISAIKQYLVSGGQLTADEGLDFELSLRQLAEAGPLFITPLVESTVRMKRALMAENDPRTGEHIKEHCAFEEEVLNTKGENEGKLLLFQAQRAENPFRMFYDDTDGSPTPLARGALEGVNWVTDLLTLGIKPLIGKLIANAKRREYYRNLGDSICVERFRRLDIAEIATSLDIDGIAFNLRGVSRNVKPAELLHAFPTQKRAAYYVQNPQNGIKKEILLELKPGSEAIHTEGRKIFLKPTEKPDEFMTYYPDAARPELLQRKVIVDEETLTWRYADTFDTTNLNVEVSEGKRQIQLHGEYYDLNKNGKGKFDIVVHKKSGVHASVPVYSEPLSKTWHLSTHNRHPVFTREQENVINTIRVEQDRDFNYIPYTNNNTRYYGSGKIYRAEKVADTSHYTWGRYIEMNGEIVPVREVVSPGRGVHYEVHSIHHPDKEHYLVSWDGRRWVFERPTSPHVSSTLEKQITSEMFTKNIDVTHLSSPDKNGLRWDVNDKSYLNVNNYFIQVKRVGDNRFILVKPVHDQKMILRLKNNKFHKEAINERLDNILTVGLSGKERKKTLDLRKNVEGYTESSARKLLTEYDFPKNRIFNDFLFLMEIKQTGKPPRWSEKYKKNKLLGNSSSQDKPTSSLTKLSLPNNKAGFNLGGKIGEGVFGKVFIDADDNSYLIKSYTLKSPSLVERIAKHEAEMFKRYYGEDAAMYFVDDKGSSYVRMYKVPGQVLNSISKGTLPDDADIKFVDMIERLNSLGIMHQDLHSGNILWDSASESFFPIDISNMKEKYFDSDISKKLKMNAEGVSYWDGVLSFIAWNKKRPSSAQNINH